MRRLLIFLLIIINTNCFASFPICGSIVSSIGALFSSKALYFCYKAKTGDHKKAFDEYITKVLIGYPRSQPPLKPCSPKYLTLMSCLHAAVGIPLLMTGTHLSLS